MKPFRCHKEKGLTLIELLVAVALSGIVISAIYSVYISQQRSYNIQEQMAEMQQNVRVAMDTMVRDIRMAGCDPTGGAGARILLAETNTIQFTSDLNGDGDLIYVDKNNKIRNDPNENITYSLYDSTDADTLDDDLGRDTGGGNQPVAENISSLICEYLDEDGEVTADLNQIRGVRISLTARTDKPDPNYGYRTRTLTTVVKVRNMGL